MFHSASSNLYLHKFALLSPVMSLMADSYCTTNTNMLNVKFHHVVSLQGILHASRSRMLRAWNHKGRRRVVEWRMVKVILLSYQNILVSRKQYYHNKSTLTLTNTSLTGRMFSSSTSWSATDRPATSSTQPSGSSHSLSSSLSGPSHLPFV